MKRQIVIVITAMFVGAMLFGSTVQAQGPTTEERLQKLESVVNGGTSTVTARTIRVDKSITLGGIRLFVKGCRIVATMPPETYPDEQPTTVVHLDRCLDGSD